MGLDNDTRAAKDFYREIRRFAERAQPWHAGVVWYQTKPDERLDPTLVSARVYGRRDEFLAVMAAAGLDTFDQLLTERMIALPGEARLTQIKRATGFESIAELRAIAVAGRDRSLPEPFAVNPVPDLPDDGSGGYDDIGTAERLMAIHLAAQDPHPQYLQEAGGVIDGGTY
ncbi:MAG TPA: hypothetical protein VIG97_07395 [Luteimonas sp.]